MSTRVQRSETTLFKTSTSSSGEWKQHGEETAQRWDEGERVQKENAWP
jgi:hypothetical protein